MCACVSGRARHAPVDGVRRRRNRTSHGKENGAVPGGALAISWNFLSAGKSFEDTIGLIETVEKNAQVYLLNGGKIQRGISEEQVRKLAEAFQLW